MTGYRVTLTIETFDEFGVKTKLEYDVKDIEFRTLPINPMLRDDRTLEFSGSGTLMEEENKVKRKPRNPFSRVDFMDI